MNEDMSAQAPALTPAQVQRIRELLAKDDVATLDQEFEPGLSLPVLNAWLLDNVLDAMARKTFVLDLWLLRAERTTKTAVLYGRLASVLESLADDDKARVLRGLPIDGEIHLAHRNLRNYLRVLAVHWYDLSPAWAGYPGSALREAALELGWTPQLTAVMAKRSMLRDPNWEAWLDRVPYVYSMVVCNWIGLEDIRNFPSFPKITPPKEGDVLFVSSKANPLDAALARHILDLGPRTLKDRLVHNPEVARVSEDIERRLHELVRMQLSLDIFHEFCHSLALGSIAGMEVLPAISLPELNV